MLVITVLTRYPLASSGTVRPGTIKLYFSTAGTAVFTTKSGDTCTITTVAGLDLETGPLESVGALPAGTLGVIGR